MSDHGWASLDATFDRAANAPVGAYQRIFDGAPEDVARLPSPLLTHVRDKFKKAKPTDVPRIPLNQRIVDPSSSGKEESFETVPSFVETAKPDSSNEDAVM